jgi:hypothetical protein
MKLKDFYINNKMDKNNCVKLKISWVDEMKYSVKRKTINY